VKAVLEHYQNSNEGGFSSSIGTLSAIELLVIYWSDIANTNGDTSTVSSLGTSPSPLPTLPTSLHNLASRISERALQTWEETVNRVEAAVERRNEAEVIDEDEDEMDSLEDETLGAGAVLDACLVRSILHSVADTTRSYTSHCTATCYCHRCPPSISTFSGVDRNSRISPPTFVSTHPIKLGFELASDDGSPFSSTIVSLSRSLPIKPNEKWSGRSRSRFLDKSGTWKVDCGAS